MRISPNLPRKMGYARRTAAAWSTDMSIGSLLFAVSALMLGIWGIGVGWDANYYLMFSQLMRLNFDFSTQGFFAPLYPMMLAALTALGASTELAVVLVHSASIAVVFLASAQLVRDAGAPPAATWLAGIYAAVVAFGSFSFPNAWTEIPYVAALTASTAIAVAFWRRTLTPSLWWFLPLGMLAPLRFVGLFPAALLSVLMVWRLWDGARPSAALFARLAGALTFVVGPIAVFAVLNQMAWGCAFGCRDPSAFSLGENLALTWSTFRGEWPQLAGGALVLAAATLATLFGSRVSDAALSEATPQDRAFFCAAWLFPLGVVVVSVGAQIYASTRVDIDPINPRYFTPLYPILVSGLVAAAWRVVHARSRPWGRPAFFTALVVALLAAGYLDTVFYSHLIREATDRRASLAEFGFKRSPMRRQFQDAQAVLLGKDKPGGIAAYFPLTEDSTNLAAYLVLDSAYGPDGAGCRAGAIRMLANKDSQIRLDCTTSRGPKELEVAVISDLARIPPDTELLIMDKSNIIDDDEVLWEVVGRQRFQVIADTPTHRLLHRKP